MKIFQKFALSFVFLSLFFSLGCIGGDEFASGVLSNNISQPSACIFQSPGLACNDNLIVEGVGVFAVISNGLQIEITNVEVACVSGTVEPTSYTAISGTFSHGQSFSVAGVDCGTLTSGDSFVGNLYLRYNYIDDPSGVPKRVSVAHLSGVVQSGS